MQNDQDKVKLLATLILPTALIFIPLILQYLYLLFNGKDIH